MRFFKEKLSKSNFSPIITCLSNSFVLNSQEFIFKGIMKEIIFFLIFEMKENERKEERKILCKCSPSSRTRRCLRESLDVAVRLTLASRTVHHDSRLLIRRLEADSPRPPTTVWPTTSCRPLPSASVSSMRQCGDD